DTREPFECHHTPFVYYANYADGTPGRTNHLRDETEIFSDLANGTLRAVSFIKPYGLDNEHPGYATLRRGQEHVAALVNAVRNSSVWKDCLIVITYDEHGGRWDHVTPPTGDEWGPGTRVPGIVISPFAKRHYVDHTQYETLSFLKLIENRFGLRALNQRDGNPKLNDFSGAMD